MMMMVTITAMMMMVTMMMVMMMVMIMIRTAGFAQCADHSSTDDDDGRLTALSVEAHRQALLVAFALSLLLLCNRFSVVEAHCRFQPLHCR